MFFANFGIFTLPSNGHFLPPNMLILPNLIMGDPQMTFGDIWSKQNLLANIVLFDPKILVIECPQIEMTFGVISAKTVVFRQPHCEI